jgi:hypothetical protein
VAKPIKVALVNDYEIVLEGLRALLRPSERQIHVVEIDVRKKPRRRVDVTSGWVNSDISRRTGGSCSGSVERNQVDFGVCVIDEY